MTVPEPAVFGSNMAREIYPRVKSPILARASHISRSPPTRFLSSEQPPPDHLEIRQRRRHFQAV